MQRTAGRHPKNRGCALSQRNVKRQVNDGRRKKQKDKKGL